MAMGEKRAVVMQGDIGVDGGVPSYIHAAQHASDGADPITPEMIGAASNPNLLDNWYFADPIDQRGGYVVVPGSSYYIPGESVVTGTTEGYYSVDSWEGTIGASNAYFYMDGTKYVTNMANTIRGYTGSGYAIDRWLTGGSATNVTKPEDDGVNLYDEASYVDFRQLIESYTELCGKNVCLSALTADGTLWVQTGKIPDELSSTLTSIFNKYDDEGSGIWLRGGAGKMFVQLRAGAGKSVTFIAAKLELGSVQTLAHQDADGNWVLNDPPPNKQQELAKCQRYYIRYTSDDAKTTIALGNSNGTYVYTPFFLPVPMRATPAISYANIDVLLLDGGTSTSIEITGVGFGAKPGRGNAVTPRIVCECESGKLYGLRVLPGGYFDFNADL